MDTMKKRFVVYPFMLAVWFVLVLAASNPGEIPGLWVLSRPLIISLLVALCAWLVLSWIARDPDRRGFLTCMVVILFASYGYFTLMLQSWSWAAPFLHTPVPFLLLVAYLAGITYAVFRLVSDAGSLSRFLTTFTAILALWAGVEVFRDAAPWRAPGAKPNQIRAAPNSVTRGTSTPDIYLIVLDKYTGNRSLRENFGFDNREFEAFLTKRGFVLPPYPHANYIYTALSLASLLNYRYLDLPVTGVGRTKAYVNRLVEDNAVWRFLRGQGYRFVFFPTEFPVTARNRLADVELPEPRQIVSEFEMAWRRTTLVQPVLSWLCGRISCGPTAGPNGEAKLLEWKFQRLSQLPALARDGHPLFVFAHLTVPHEPYIFNADCSMRPPMLPSYYVVTDEAAEKKAYLAQVTCLNRRLETIVASLLRNSPTPPIILLQSDHGHGRMPLYIPELDALTPDRIAERSDVFAAYHLPGVKAKIIADSISPVNVFRTVFRQYFQADLPPLPDMTFWSSGNNEFRFTRVSGGYRPPD
jgi:hypothetical protein